MDYQLFCTEVDSFCFGVELLFTRQRRISSRATLTYRNVSQTESLIFSVLAGRQSSCLRVDMEKQFRLRSDMNHLLNQTH